MKTYIEIEPTWVITRKNDDDKFRMYLSEYSDEWRTWNDNYCKAKHFLTKSDAEIAAKKTKETLAMFKPMLVIEDN